MAAWDQRRAKVAGRAYGLEDAQQMNGYGVTAQHPRARMRVTTAWFDGVRTLPGDLLYDTGQDEDEWRAEAANERRPAGAQELPRLRRGRGRSYMRARDIVGKTITRVVQTRASLGEGRQVTTQCEAIEFSDGSWLRFLINEGDDEHGIELIYPARADERSRPAGAQELPRRRRGEAV